MPVIENQISKIIVDAAVEVHRELGGPGLLEDVYEEALAEELRLRGVQVERQLPVRIVYKGRVLSKPLRLDMRVEKLVLVDNKAVTQWNPVFESQMLTYLRLTGLRLGLVLNFGERVLKAGIHRVVNGLPEDPSFNAETQRRRPRGIKDLAPGTLAPRLCTHRVFPLLFVLASSRLRVSALNPTRRRRKDADPAALKINRSLLRLRGFAPIESSPSFVF